MEYKNERRTASGNNKKKTNQYSNLDYFSASFWLEYKKYYLMVTILPHSPLPISLQITLCIVCQTRKMMIIRNQLCMGRIPALMCQWIIPPSMKGSHPLQYKRQLWRIKVLKNMSKETNIKKWRLNMKCGKTNLGKW